MREKQVTLSDDRIVAVKKLPIGKFGQLLIAIQSAFTKIKPFLASIESVDQMNDTEFVATVMPKLLADALPEVLQILSLGTDMEPAEIEELGIDEVSDILVAFSETNDMKKIFENTKKILTSLGIGDKSESTNGSSESPTNSPANTDGAGEKS
jgi:hypothetical protein